jgi:hypothetical protein
MKYMLLIYGPDIEPSAEPGAGPMPDIEPWVAYTKWLQETGRYIAGEPLAPTSAATSVRVKAGQRLVTDGPFAETKEVLGGYYILQCDDLDSALEAAARCPGAAAGTIEVRPILEMPVA